MTGALAFAAETLLGSTPLKTCRLHGGDLSDVSLLVLLDGREIVAKQGPMVAREARMLQAMSQAGAPVPLVIAHDGAVLFLEYLPEGPASPESWRALGSGLRQLHGTTNPTPGWPEDYAFGDVTIPNTPTADWPAFWAERRLLAHIGTLPPDIAHRLERLAREIDTRLPAISAPALLHGDLWSGNVHFDSHGGAWLIDPACYFGDAEVDLAMLHLFGTPHAAFWEGYGSPAPGWRERLPLYQLWPAIVHLRLFGAAYRPMVTSRLDTIGV